MTNWYTLIQSRTLRGGSVLFVNSIKKDIRRLSITLFGDSKKSYYRYKFPVDLPEYRFFLNSPAHKGKFANAVDIEVPNSEQTPITIYAPQSGIVRYCVLSNSTWGTSSEFKGYLNWIHVEVGNDEFYEIAHIASHPKKIIRVGTKVKIGEPILLTALNGWVTTTNGVPDYHVHFLVGRWSNKEKGEFESLKIKWRK